MWERCGPERRRMGGGRPLATHGVSGALPPCSRHASHHAAGCCRLHAALPSYAMATTSLVGPHKTTGITHTLAGCFGYASSQKRSCTAPTRYAAAHASLSWGARCSSAAWVAGGSCRWGCRMGGGWREEGQGGVAARHSMRSMVCEHVSTEACAELQTPTQGEGESMTGCPGSSRPPAFSRGLRTDMRALNSSLCPTPAPAGHVWRLLHHSAKRPARGMGSSRPARQHAHGEGSMRSPVCCSTASGAGRPQQQAWRRSCQWRQGCR